MRTTGLRKLTTIAKQNAPSRTYMPERKRNITFCLSILYILLPNLQNDSKANKDFEYL